MNVFDMVILICYCKNELNNSLKTEYAEGGLNYYEIINRFKDSGKKSLFF